jgi:2Fe-2S ferredoxin
MPRITYVAADGRRFAVDVPVGHSLMEGAVDNAVPGVLAECGGACACATCHAYIDGEWAGRVPPAEPMEDAMLDTAADRRPTSRLTCQIEVTPALDGLVVHVARNGA